MVALVNEGSDWCELWELTSPRLEGAGNARPRMPSIGSLLKLLERVVTGEKYCLVTETPATLTVPDHQLTDRLFT